MFSLRHKVDCTLKIIFLAIQYNKKNIWSWIFFIVYGLFFSSMFFIFLAIEHTYFKISVLNFETVVNMVGFTYVDHVKQTLFWLLFFVVSIIFAFIMNYMCVHEMLKFVEKEKRKTSTYRKSLQKGYKEVIRYGFIIACDYLISLISLIYFDVLVGYIQDICDGNPIESSVYRDTSTMIIFPLIIDNPSLSFKDTRKMAVDIFDKTFSSSAQRAYSFSFIVFLYILIMIFLVKISSLLLPVSRESVFIFGVGIGAFLLGLILLARLYFETMVYLYCKNRKIYTYSEDFIIHMFVKKSPENV